MSGDESQTAAVTLCREVFDDNSEPTDKGKRLCSLSHPHFIDYIPELLEYASKIGIDTNSEKHLLYIAREGLLAELPNGWKPWFVK